ncbi:DgaE family pyridoxal phosphate-dependent ammonia lyase [Cytobacillus praedii]|uniref:DgaE family pyridoxal phosphate-dependent ammonia lyase n=1 Tax=Cytobacillus praedii TaxID=1742358 RepID=A0A4R1B0K6_9BACI|nr:DgaE family pyridoxal phosphate-dependent ammonia lyase [Cytobacillus praedii]TCJ05874.1 DgaE family pyridoxal phosphate-dependent ammonia lyase [Cytobacillus praedii]
MSILGVSTPSNTVMEAVKQGGQIYVEIDEFIEKSGEIIAKTLGSEAAAIVNSASSGIALSIAALVTKGNRRMSERLHQESNPLNEIIMLKGHNVQYGAPVETMIYLGGGRLVEAGYANEGRAEHIEDAITNNTAGILYIQSHHSVQKNMLTLEEAWEIAKRNRIPFIVDAAAEEDIHKYIHYSDLVIYSGSKALEGPTSGIVAGKRKYIDWLRVQFSGIGRSMKIGKENRFGLLQALEEYMLKKNTNELEIDRLHSLLPLNEINGIKVSIVEDESGRKIYRARINIDPNITKFTAEDITSKLREGNIAIYTRDYGAKQGFFEIDPRPLKEDDIKIIKKKLLQILGGV